MPVDGKWRANRSRRGPEAAIRLAIGAGGAALGAAVGLTIHPADAGHSIEDGACWKPPVNCRTNYASRSSVRGTPGGLMPIYNIREWESGSYEYNVLDEAAIHGNALITSQDRSGRS